jgi:hypothetical protein
MRLVSLSHETSCFFGVPRHPVINLCFSCCIFSSVGETETNVFRFIAAARLPYKKNLSYMYRATGSSPRSLLVLLRAEVSVRFSLMLHHNKISSK